MKYLRILLLSVGLVNGQDTSSMLQLVQNMSRASCGGAADLARNQVSSSKARARVYRGFLKMCEEYCPAKWAQLEKCCKKKSDCADDVERILNSRGRCGTFQAAARTDNDCAKIFAGASSGSGPDVSAIVSEYFKKNPEPVPARAEPVPPGPQKDARCHEKGTKAQCDHSMPVSFHHITHGCMWICLENVCDSVPASGCCQWFTATNYKQYATETAPFEPKTPLTATCASQTALDQIEDIPGWVPLIYQKVIASRTATGYTAWLEKLPLNDPRLPPRNPEDEEHLQEIYGMQKSPKNKQEIPCKKVEVAADAAYPNSWDCAEASY